MPRQPRNAPGGLVYHVLNRANATLRLFDSPGQYDTFVRILSETAAVDAMRILAYCVMPNHWHLLVWPRRDGDLSRFVQRLSVGHTQHRHACRETTGRGHLYQGRFHSFPVQDDRYLFAVCRYIERNPVRAGLAKSAVHWPWSSAAAHCAPDEIAGADRKPAAISRGSRISLTPLPTDLTVGWSEFLRGPDDASELAAARACLQRGAPFGDPTWQRDTASRLGLRLEPKPRGRPPKSCEAG